MEYLNILIAASIIHFLAVISPGPDFILTMRNSMKYSRRTGIYTSIGLGMGIAIHVTYSLLGVGLLISQSILLFSIIKFAGASYLIYIGLMSIRARHQPKFINQEVKQQDLSKIKAIKMGFITNLTNPKATLFFLSLFTVIINQSVPAYIKIILGVEMSLVTFLWFSSISILITHNFIKKRISAIQKISEKIMGGILILLGIKLAMSSSK